MIAVSGATGFVGRAVADALRARGIRVVTIGRRPDADIRWPVAGKSFESRELELLGTCRAVVHLAGESIGARWTRSRRRAIRESRVGLTSVLAGAMASVTPRPAALLSASAMGYYGNRGDEWLDEEAAPGTDFLARLVIDWEGATTPAAEAGVRVVHMRFGLVIGPGGIFSRVRIPFQLGLGGRLGSGRQWMSWISLEDVVDFVMRAVDDEAFRGPVNVSTPNPVTNTEFTAALASLLSRPAILHPPAFALRLALGEMADALLLTSHRMRPGRMMGNRFGYTHAQIDGALRAALGMRAA